MHVLDSIEALRAARRALVGTVAFVPTMGYLHEGHLSLMRAGLQRCDHLIVSIYVNPTQFGPNEDLSRYPRDPQGDRLRCEREGCALLFMPSNAEMYPTGHATHVSVSGLTEGLCATSRPGHFEGVATIVTKLFNIVQPDVALFGEKDYQQLAVIRRLVRDLDLTTEIVGCPIVREDDGLAMSSRNRFLQPEDRLPARSLHAALSLAADAWAGGERDAGQLVELARTHIERHDGARVDYIECVHPENLRAHERGRLIATDEGAIMALAVFVGSTRLIDNMRLDGPTHDRPADRAQP
ncbi:MAG: pantoate--beta-alanine ligase [Bradymonadaceae bacterium]|nr:pantoate--beta-alanine ligase [Lujinxingiaceae bacterium]